MNRMNQIMQEFQTFMQNPMNFLLKRYNIPQDVNTSDPNEIIQHLLNTGQITQEQVNNAMKMRNNPLIQNLMKR